MPTLHLTVYGADGDDTRHLYEILTNLEYVDDVDITFPPELPPGEMRASAHYVEVVIHLFELGGAILATEELKTQYKALREHIKKWKDEENTDSKRERITLEFTKRGELAVPSSKPKKKAEPRAAVLRRPRKR